MHAALLGLRLHGAGFPVASPRSPAGSRHPRKGKGWISQLETWMSELWWGLLWVPKLGWRMELICGVHLFYLWEVTVSNLAHIADVGLSLSSRGRQLHFSVYGIKPEGNRRGRSQKKSASDTPVEEEDEKLKGSTPVKESSELSSNEEILALFRRIQSSISKGERVVRKKRSTRKDSQSPKQESYDQRQDPKQKQAGVSRRSRDQQPRLRRDTSSNDGNIVKYTLTSESFKPSRPPSNFVKRSPISLASLPREYTTQVVGEELPATATEGTPGVQKIDGLKLSELKELAKSRGVKGYSKLKKGQLVDLLKKLPNLE